MTLCHFLIGVKLNKKLTIAPVWCIIDDGDGDNAREQAIFDECIEDSLFISSGGLDTLPHNGAVITTLAIFGLTHKQAYKDIFVTSVVIPIFVTFLMVLGTSEEIQVISRHSLIAS